MSNSLIGSLSITPEELRESYGNAARKCTCGSKKLTFVFSQSRPFDLVELEQLLQAVGWSRRPARRVQRALSGGLLSVGLWQHDPAFPRLIGFARCTGDGVLEATVWDVAIHPLFQGDGLGKELMAYTLDALRKMGTERVTLFADPEVIPFYKRLGWKLEPRGNRCAFWYAN